MKTVSLIIDGKRITAREGDNLLWVARDNGFFIPALCSLREDTEPVAACRLCFVEIEGKNNPVTACTETVTDGMVVNTKGEKALHLARHGFELLIASHNVDCTHCGKNRDCELQQIAKHLHVSLRTGRLPKLERGLPVDDSHPRFIYDPGKCVLCGRCVRVCRKQGTGALGFAHRGFNRVVTTFGDSPISAIDCGHCTACIMVCPTGALLLRQGVTALVDK